MVLPQNGPSWQCVSHGFAPEVALLTGKYIYDYDLKANNSQKIRLHPNGGGGGGLDWGGSTDGLGNLGDVKCSHYTIG